ncbi:flagellar assembly protein FliW [uncultured Jatrophihabitans sp.]|uniref:flagellar assembly protein FliW n=1 Tax=uncultured Jatrophihabitans sp. TaxID=1610747 RepID=UPI0035CC8278
MTAPNTEQALRFVQPLPGFEDEDTYSLQAIDEHATLFSMRSVSRPDIRFVLTPSNYFFDDYLPDLGSDVETALDVADGDDVTVLVVLTISGDGLSDATANLRAPIVVSNNSGRALQVILDDESLPMRRPLVG